MDQLTETDSISEMAGFWDTHDVTDFEEALEEVREPVFQRKEQLTIDCHHLTHKRYVGLL